MLSDICFWILITLSIKTGCCSWYLFCSIILISFFKLCFSLLDDVSVFHVFKNLLNLWLIKMFDVPEFHLVFKDKFLQSRLNFCFIFSINEVSAWFTNHYSIKLTKKNKKNNHSFPLLTWGYNKLKQSQNNTILFKYLFIVKWIKATASKFNTLLSSSCQFTFLTKKSPVIYSD